MAKITKSLLVGTKRLRKDKKVFKQHLREATESMEAINSGDIDALVSVDKKVLKVYTENAADKLYRILIEKMHEGAVTLNEKGIILYCNSYFATLVNLPLQKVIGTAFKKFITDSCQVPFDALLTKGWRSNSQNEIDIVGKDGKNVPVMMTLNKLSMDNNSVLSIILTNLAVQNRNQLELKHRTRQLEEINVELENANRDLTTFTYIASHDLQEPLRKIQNFAGMIVADNEVNLPDKGKEYFQKMIDAARRMQALIEDLLTYARTKSADRKFIKTDLKSIVNEVRRDYEEEIEKKGATIEANDLGDASIIPVQFHQLMHNLVLNSLKFSKPNSAPNIIITSEIALGSKLNNTKLAPKTNYCHITISDNGIGFEPQYNERIFEVFQRLHGREEYKGTGMGLAICKRIVENHNGIMTATGKLNAGARFDIYLPA